MNRLLLPAMILLTVFAIHACKGNNETVEKLQGEWQKTGINCTETGECTAYDTENILKFTGEGCMEITEAIPVCIDYEVKDASILFERGDFTTFTWEIVKLDESVLLVRVTHKNCDSCIEKYEKITY